MQVRAFTTITAAIIATGLAGCGGGGASVKGEKADQARVLEGGNSLSIEAVGRSKIDKIEMMTWQIEQTDGPPDTENRISFTNTDCRDHISTEDAKYADIWRCSLGVTAAPTVQAVRKYTVTAVVLNKFDTEAKLSYRLRVEPSSSSDLAVDAGQNQVVKPGDAVALTCDYANGAFDEGKVADQAKINWTVVDDADLFIRGFEASGLEATFEAPAPRSTTDLVFQCAVTDGAGVTVSDDVKVTVIGTTDLEPLQADAGQVQSVPVGETVFLNASGTTDPTDSGLAIYYRWEQIAGPKVDLAGVNGETAMFSPPATLRETTDFVFRLYASRVPIDKDTEFAESEIDQTTVRVEFKTIAIRPNVSAPATADEHTNVVLDGSASSAEDGSNLYYYWEQTAGPAVYFDDPTASSTAFMAPEVAEDTDVVIRMYVSTEPVHHANKNEAQHSTARVTIQDVNGY